MGKKAQSLAFVPGLKHFNIGSLLAGIFISSNELVKLSILFLLLREHVNHPLMISIVFGVPQFFGSMLEGYWSDYSSRRVWLIITLAASAVAMGSMHLFSFTTTLVLSSMAIFAFFGNTTPIAMALIGDQHDRDSLRNYFAFGNFFRALPWAFIGLLAMLVPINSFSYVGLYASLFSLALCLCASRGLNLHQKYPEKGRAANIFNKFSKWAFFVWIFGFFLAQYNYQSISYFSEEREQIASLIRSYTSFGFGMCLGSILHMFFLKTSVNSRKWVFILLFIWGVYYLCRFVLFSWIEDISYFHYDEKFLLGGLSGGYLPFIYLMFCERVRHHKGLMCGIIEAVMGGAELLGPFSVVYLGLLSGNAVFLVVGIMSCVAGLFFLKSNKPLRG